MSNAATSWAAKSGDVKLSQAPAQVAEPTTARGTPKKNSMALNGEPSPPLLDISTDNILGTTNGVKKSNWADSDGEEDFLTSFTSTERVKELEETVTAKDARITDLTTAVQEKDTRIAELESTLDELQKENHKQFLHVQKLVAEVDEKDRRIAALETEVDQHCATIAELGVGENSTQVSSHQAAPATNAADTPAATTVKVKAQHETIDTNKQAEPAAQTAIKAAPTDTNALVSPSAKTVSTKAAGPSVNFSAFPVFATPVTVKHTAPPPPAPKLKMPVDLSKFVKKLAAKSAAPKKKVEATSDETAKDGPAPKIDPTSDIRMKRREERALFANGPKVQVKMGDTGLSTVPKYVLMQCSHKAFKHFTDDPDANTFTLAAGSMDEAAAKAHLEWMNEMTYQGRVYSVTLHSDEKFDDKNFQICRAARVLGLNNVYVGHFTKIFCDRIRSNTASYEFLHKIAALAYPENDPLYDCLANNLANLRTRNAVEKPAELEALLKKHTGLKARVEKIEERMRKKQDGMNSVKGPNNGKDIKVVHVGKKMDM